MNGEDIVFPNPSPHDWFVIGARVDMSNGSTCRVYATSWSPDLHYDCKE